MVLTFDVPDTTMCSVLTYTYAVGENIAEGVTQLQIDSDNNTITAYGMDYDDPEVLSLEEVEEEDVEDDDFPSGVPFFDKNTPGWRHGRRR